MDLLVVGELALPAVSVSPEDNLYDALVVFLQSCYGQIPIEDKELGVIGVLKLEDLMETYHCEIQNLRE